MLKQNMVINKYTEKSGELEGDFFIGAWEMKLWWICKFDSEEIVIERRNSYLSFLLHRQDFWIPNFYTQKLRKTPKNYNKYPKKVYNMQFFAFNLENFTPDRIFLHGHRPWCPRQIWGMATYSGRRFALDYPFKSSCRS